MTYVIGGLAGLAYGVLFGLLKKLALPRKKESMTFMKQTYLYMGISSVVNILVLLSVYFLRNVLPFSYEAALIGAAVGLSVCGKIVNFRFQKQAGASVSRKNGDCSTEEMK